MRTGDTVTLFGVIVGTRRRGGCETKRVMLQAVEWRQESKGLDDGASDYITLRPGALITITSKRKTKGE